MIEDNNPRKSATDFLLYSYFGIYLNQHLTTDDIIQAAIDKAYKDATMQGAYRGYNKDRARKARDTCSDVLRGNIDNLLGKNQEAYDNKHKKICTKFVEKYNDNLFTYGNAQKWLNMTMKNLYVICGAIEEFADEEVKKFCKEVFNSSKTFHAPVDNFVLKSIWKIEAVELPIKKGSTRKKDFNTSKLSAPWSQWEYKEYNAFQDSLRKYVKSDTSYDNPFEWELDQWLNEQKDE